jgi:activator of HSP90 ATPase
METIRVSDEIPVGRDELYAAWLDGDRHAQMTGAGAEGSDQVGGQFSAWDGYITGTNLELEPGRRIVQAWRTSQFPQAAPDSRLEISFEPVASGTRVEIVHSAIPDGQGKSYEAGWVEHYFDPIKRHYRAAR